MCSSLTHVPRSLCTALQLTAGVECVPFGIQVQLPDEIRDFVRASTGNYGKVKLVLQRNKFFVESAYPDVLRKLLKARDLMHDLGLGLGLGACCATSCSCLVCTRRCCASC